MCHVQVEFVGEEGEDMGGPTREMFRLVRHEMAKKYLEETRCFKLDSTALDVCGQIIDWNYIFIL